MIQCRLCTHLQWAESLDRLPRYQWMGFHHLHLEHHTFFSSRMLWEHYTYTPLNELGIISHNICKTSRRWDNDYFLSTDIILSAFSNIKFLSPMMQTLTAR